MRRLALALCLLLVTASSEGAEVPLPASLRPGDHRAPINGAVGKRDFVTSEKFANVIHAGIPGSRLVILEHSGHMGHIEEPAAFAGGIRTFLKSLP
jgi:proline iminopeptidase